MATRELREPLKDCRQFDTGEAVQTEQTTDRGQHAVPDGPSCCSTVQQIQDAAADADPRRQLWSCDSQPVVAARLFVQKAAQLARGKAEDEAGTLGIRPVAQRDAADTQLAEKCSHVEAEPESSPLISLPADLEDAMPKSDAPVRSVETKMEFEAAPQKGIDALDNNWPDANLFASREVGVVGGPCYDVLPVVLGRDKSSAFAGRAPDTDFFPPCQPVGDELFDYFGKESLPVMLSEFEACTQPPEPETVEATASPPGSPPARIPMECSDDRDDSAAECYTGSLSSAACCSDASPWPPGFSRLDLLGRGTFGEAYLAKRQLDGKLLVIKQVPRKHYKADEFLLPHHFPHENLVRMLDQYEMESAVCLVQDYVPGDTLQAIWVDCVTKGCTVDEAYLDQLGLQMVRALGHLASHRIVHRDVKLANIIRTHWIDTGPRFVLIDFGLSEQLLDGEEVRCNRGFRGSPAYAAPECHKVCTSKVCQEGYNTKADLWSLGMSIMQMCSFEVPFNRRSYDNIKSLLLHQPGLMQDRARDERIVRCSPAWRALLVRMLSPRAADRPPPGELLEELDKKCSLALPDLDSLH